MTSFENIGNKWTKKNGEVRYYVNDWKDMIGLDVEYHKSGNVSSVYLGDRELSNNYYKKYVAGTKVWFGEDKQVHVDYCDEDWIVEKIVDAVGKKLAEVA